MKKIVALLVTIAASVALASPAQAGGRGRPVIPPPDGCHYSGTGYLVCGRPVTGNARVAFLMEKHDCDSYRNLRLDGMRVPTGHVVLRWPSGAVTYTGRERPIRLALENVRQTKHQWLTVQGFCA